MLCSVVILNWNGTAVMREFLPSVLAHTTMPDTEVVVVDNGSTDDSLAYLHSIEGTPQAGQAHLRIIAFDTNYGFADGYNRAIATLDSTFTVLLNSDVMVTEGWLQPVLDYMQSHPDVAAAQPKILSYPSLKNHQQHPDEPVTFEHAGAAGGYIDRLGYPFCRGRIMNYVADDRHQYDTIADIFWASGAALFVRTEVYKQVGGLDAAFFAHMEEIDFCWRLNSRGYRIVCVPQSEVYHLGGGALAYDNPKKTYLNFRNNLLMLYKNMPAARLAGVALCRWVLDYVAAFHELLIGKPQQFAAVLRARRDYWRMRGSFAGKRQENRRLARPTLRVPLDRRMIIFDFFIRHLRE